MTTERFNVSMVKNIGPMTTDLRVVFSGIGKDKELYDRGFMAFSPIDMLVFKRCAYGTEMEM